MHKLTVNMRTSFTGEEAGGSEGVYTFFNSTLSTCVSLQQYPVL